MDMIRYGYNGKLLTILQDHYGNPWWVAKEVCDVLEYTDSHDATKRHCKHPKLLKTGETPVLKVPPRGLLIINEPDLYRLIVNCNLPSAEPFEAWIFEEVLPSIRKTGAYQVKNTRRGRPAGGDPDDELNDIMKQQRRLHQIFEHAYRIAKRMTSSGKEASIMAQAKVEELTGINLAESYRLPEGMKSQAEVDRDTINAFVDDCCLTDETFQIPATELYQAFSNWYAHHRSGKAPTQKWFGTRIGQRFSRRKYSVYHYDGIKLKRSIPTDEGYIHDFIDECCGLGEQLRVAVHVLYERFSNFYRERSGQIPVPLDRFIDVLSTCFSIAPDEENILNGIGLLQDPTVE